MEEYRDDQLLRYWVENGSQWAFAEIGRRYAGLVFSACLRELGDPTLSEDASQAVFLLLAQKAPKLRKEGALAGWLFRTSQLVSQSVRRQERRRIIRETRAAQVMTITREADSESHALWNDIAPHLNTALARLKPAEREAILLRYLQGRSLAETGTALGVTENAARMRISRALDKLRAYLAKAGLAVSVVALASLLSEQATQAAPVTLLDTIDGIAAGSLGASGTTLAASKLTASKTASAASQTSRAYLLAKGATVIMAISTGKTVAVVTGVALIVLLGGGAALHNRSSSHRVRATRNQRNDPARAFALAMETMQQIEVAVIPKSQINSVLNILDRARVRKYTTTIFKGYTEQHVAVPPNKAEQARQALMQHGIHVPAESRTIEQVSAEYNKRARRSQARNTAVANPPTR